MFNIFKKKQSEPKGYVKYFGIENIWLNTLSENQRNQIKTEYAKGVGTDPRSIDEKNIVSTTQTKSSFLMMLAEYVDEKETVLYLIDKSIEEAEKSKDVEEKHFVYMRGWRILKQLIKTNPELIEKYIQLLKKDCNIHEEFNKQYKENYNVIPRYPAFKELAIIYERTNRLAKAIEISNEALKRNVNEETSFERRISKLEKKLTK